jgi:glycosyltransferase involved in cell wall biosynthesis
VVENTNEKGAGRAVLQGFKATGRPILVTLDADGQHSPEDIPMLLAPIVEGKADFVVGKRPRQPASEKPVRRAVKSIIGRNLDVGSGFRAFRSHFLTGMKPSDVGCCGCGSFLLYAVGRGARIAEVPTKWLPRKHGRSRFAHVQKNRLHRDQAKFLLARYGNQ